MPGGITPGRHRQKFADEFKRRAQECHDGNLDFELTDYQSASATVTVRCKRHDIVFQLTPARILTGSTACAQCKKERPRRRIKTVQDFISAAREAHGDVYNYSLIEGIKTLQDYVSIICKEHGTFEQRAILHLERRGCKHCTMSEACRRYTTESFIRESKAVFGDWWDYSKVEYVNGHDQVTLICPEHGEFQQEASTHLKGSVGCRACHLISVTKSTEWFIAAAKLVHGDQYDYSQTEYFGSTEHLVIVCPMHGAFEQVANGHLSGHGCSKCFKRMSKMSRDWLAYMAVRLEATIEHGDNAGEFVFPERRRWKSDGYVRDTNTILEFHGDYWHGNPSLYNPGSIHPHDVRKRTFGEMYQATLAREAQIRAWGYNLISVWEADWKRAVAAVKVIQQTWRSRKHLRSLVSYRLSDVWPRV